MLYVRKANRQIQEKTRYTEWFNVLVQGLQKGEI
jgi:hypothetical protein